MCKFLAPTIIHATALCHTAGQGRAGTEFQQARQHSRSQSQLFQLIVHYTNIQMSDSEETKGHNDIVKTPESLEGSRLSDFQGA